jgi:hypothetical protein
MLKIKRALKHLVAGHWQIKKLFPDSALRAIEKAIGESERLHGGELRFAVEAGLAWEACWRGVTARARAIDVFSQLRVWDTEHNSGVLIYLLLADRRVEIVADRGIHARVGDAEWGRICRNMERRFRTGEFEAGVLEGIAEITALLKEHFPANGARANELDNRPVIL